jgi:two-component system sensor histidine kinase HydH
MNRFLFGWYSGPLVVLGGLVAIICLTSTWYINRLQTDLSRAIRHDVARLEAAEKLQIGLRQLRFRSFMAIADPSPARWKLVDDDRQLVQQALATARQECETEADSALLARIDSSYADYEVGLTADTKNGVAPLTNDSLIRWADAHPVQGLLVPCRELAERQRERMRESLERSESQTTWAGRVLLGLGLTGVLAGILSGYATARALTRRVAQLSVRVQAVQAHLDQNVGALTVEASQHFGDLDSQLERVVGRVKEVCQRLQEQERNLLRTEQLAAVGQLAAGVAHEIRNPLTGITFLVEAALRPMNPIPLSSEDLNLVRQELLRIERTVQGLMDFARTPPPDRREYDLRELVAEAVGVTRSRAEAKPVIVGVDSPPEPAVVVVDRGQLLSLLRNLLLNAIDATPPGGGITVRLWTSGYGTQIVEVSDTGLGIDAAIADRLFTPFTSTKATGTGLGLTVARRVAQDHQGTLIATNRPEGGACFTLTLPTAKESHSGTPVIL